jgi:spermidine synthase/MFS family permease
VTAAPTTRPTAPPDADPTPARLPVILAYPVVFLSSACSLILEIVAGRILAPYIGVSLYTWTSIIGVVLAGISLGNYVGGRVADRWSSQRTLGIILLAGGLASLLVLPLTLTASNHDLFWLNCASSPLGALCTPQLAIMVKIVLLTALIFFLPSFVLGMVSPVVVRLSLSDLATSGNTVGKIYAFSTLGSIVGTFLTGFWLILTFGTREIVLGVGALLVFMAVLLGNLWRVRRPTEGFVNIGGAFLLFCLIGLIDRTQALASGCYRETGYYCIKVYDQAHGDRTLRTLVLDHLVHSYSDLSDPTYYEYAYVKVYAEITDYLARQRPDYRALFIGGGGYTLPRGMVITHPASSVEVVEIDPGVTQTAYDQMGVAPDGRIVTHNVDARLYFDQIQGGPKLDLVFGDAFNDLSVPYHLTTREFDQQVRNVLNDDGFYLVNVIDKLNGGLFIPSFVRTLKTVFPHVYVMSAGTPWLSQVSFPNTFIVVGTATPLDPDRLRQVQTQSGASSVVTNVMPSDLMEQWLTDAPGVTLTDDFAPADNLVAPLFAERGL